MQLDEYQEKAKRTAIHPSKYKVIYPAIGLANETGEVLGKIKKWMRGDDGEGEMSKERKEAIQKEMGDVLWYFSTLASELGFSLNDIAVENIGRLQKRAEKGVLMGDGDTRENA